MSLTKVCVFACACVKERQEGVSMRVWKRGGDSVCAWVCACVCVRVVILWRWSLINGGYRQWGGPPLVRGGHFLREVDCWVSPTGGHSRKATTLPGVVTLHLWSLVERGTHILTEVGGGSPSERSRILGEVWGGSLSESLHCQMFRLYIKSSLSTKRRSDPPFVFWSSY